MKITELHKLGEKQKWQRRFLKAYSGETVSDSSQLYGINVRFFIASDKDAEFGFVRINDKTKFFKSQIPFQVWNLTDGYVKPPYRSKGILRKLIEYVVKDCEVRMIYIQTDRFLRNYNYYQSLGFNNHYTVKNGEFTFAFQDDVWSYVVEE